MRQLLSGIAGRTALLVACVTIAVVCFAVAPDAVTSIARGILPFDDPTGLTFKVWQDMTAQGVRMERHYYAYNVTNPHAVVEQHAVPNFNVVGPFVYREVMTSPLDGVEWFANSSMQYGVHNDFFFLPEKSIDAVTGERLTEDYNITNVNMALFAMVHRVQHMPHVPFSSPITPATTMKELACLLLELATAAQQVVGKTGLFTTRTAGELLFKGYTDEILLAFKHLEAVDSDLRSRGEEPLAYRVPTRFHYQFNHTTPAPAPYTTRYGQTCPLWDDEAFCNNTGNRPSHMWTGAAWGIPTTASSETGGLSQIGSITQWAGHRDLPWWGEGACRELAGSNAMSYPPGMTVGAAPTIYIADVYRSLQLKRDGATSVRGVPTRRYTPAADVFGLSECNACYQQQYAGTINMTAVVFAPVVAGQPFFEGFDAAAPLLHPVVAMPAGVKDARRALNITFGPEQQPFLSVNAADRGQYETFVDVYEDFGLMMKGSARIQSNTMLAPIKIDGCKNFYSLTDTKTFTDAKTGARRESLFPETLVPILYVDRNAELPAHLANYLKTHVLAAYTLAAAVGVAMVVFAVLLLAWIAVDVRRAWEVREDDYGEGAERLNATIRSEGSLGSDTKGSTIEDNYAYTPAINMEDDR
jgi:hypothetical protein